ncbi:hypothetical protein CKAH01_02176 [Colletotrichum kahawae]|uniref:Uncharacterized protein n=1 Tax=Colletotrichum kahawae TaxID=34407 RepID=A0AAD9Y0E4_COLKA|nr:hypothetical protein CKAH01_02176 [Colletotrichum kahawae]
MLLSKTRRLHQKESNSPPTSSGPFPEGHDRTAHETNQNTLTGSTHQRLKRNGPSRSVNPFREGRFRSGYVPRRRRRASCSLHLELPLVDPGPSHAATVQTLIADWTAARTARILTNQPSLP